MTDQEKELLAEMNAEPVTEEHIRRASQFIGAAPYTHLSLLAIAEVCEREFEHAALGQVLREAAIKVAELECQVI